MKRNVCNKINYIFIHGNVVNFFIVYELDIWSRHLHSDFALSNCLFGAAKLTKNSDPDKYTYLGCGVGFDSRSLFLFSNFDFGKNVIIFGVDNISSTHTDNRKNYISLLSEGPRQ